MPQTAQKGFPGFGIIYPGGGARGLKIVNTFTQGSAKVVHPDGSVTYSTPPPVIHELFGGGFAYADGNPVTNRDHLELITSTHMKERALKWYDTHGKAISPQDIVVRDEDATIDRPEPAYILSSQLPEGSLEQGPVDIGKEPIEANTPQERILTSLDTTLSAITKGISDLTTIVMKQGEEIAQLKSKPIVPRKRNASDLVSKRSLSMRAKWADPEYKKAREELREAKMKKVAPQQNTAEVKDETG